MRDQDQNQIKQQHSSASSLSINRPSRRRKEKINLEHQAISLFPNRVSSLGINYGQIANNLPIPDNVVPLVKSIDATRVKLYKRNPNCKSVVRSPTRSLTTSPVIHLNRRRSTLRILFS
ncbi:Glucan 1 [Forsythia ovata]|uniref:Glucan 1 n=1 Tax=Forsythia ovata TaxID=205694 RepID=A0ABD1RKH8_9LAMI